jgi:outer membrane receptor protein involved in Fe transport
MSTVIRKLGLTALVLLAISLTPAAALAGGTVSGVVIDGLTGQPIIGAELVVEGADVKLTSQLGGAFTGQIAAGTYSVVVRKGGFESQKVTGVEVTDGGVTDFAVVLLPLEDSSVPVDAEATAEQAAFSEEITVVAEVEKATEVALLAERKGAMQISDSIGAEEMKKNTGSDAAGALKRVTGISLQDNKYVFVRGLGERYSNTSLNGSRIPSTEFEKKVVPLDLFPAGLLEKLRVSKSYTVDKPGDFAAGLVELETLDFPAQQTASLGFSLGSNSVTTGESFGQYGDGLSWSGDGGQPLPTDFPAEAMIRSSFLNPIGFTPEELEQYGEMLIGMWTPRSVGSAPMNLSYNGTYGNTFGRLGLVLSGSHNHGYQNSIEEQNLYRMGPDGVEPVNTYDLDFSTEKIKRGMMASASYRITDTHHIKLRSMFTESSAAETRLQEGYYDDAGTNIRDWRIRHKQQRIESFQMAGEHFFNIGALGSMLEWRASRSTATTEENLRETNYYEQASGTFIFTDNAQSGFMYFNDLEDDLDDFNLDWTQFLNGDSYYGSLKAGIAYSTRDRQFDGRRIRFFHRNTTGIDLSLPPEQILTAENIRPDGFELEEITRATDSYTGTHDIDAAYAQADLTFGAWRAIAGLRYERSEQEVITFSPNKPLEEPIVTLIESNDPLPALSLVYRLRDDSNLRFAASQTVNRPEFRELAPFKFTHLVGGYATTGNPNLEQAEIRSYDIRWEWFPSGGEVVAASLFYKEFDRPIESVLLAAVERLQTYRNAEGARNFGIELEGRRQLGVLGPAFEGFTAICNLTWVDSQIELGEDNILTNKNRPLVGQPDYVGNLVLEWISPKASTGIRLLYNYTSDKVESGGVYGIPDVIEEGRGTLDLVWRQSFDFLVKGLTFKLSASNLTEEDWLYTQGGEVYRRWEPGRSLSMSIGLNLY